MYKLHSSHMSTALMQKTICGVWIWEGLKNNLDQLVQNCSVRQDWAHSKQRQAPREIPEELIVTGPMEKVGIDLCSWKGRNYWS